MLAYRELDDALGLTAMAGETLADARTGKNGRHALVGLLRQSVFGRLAGYEDVNDAERLRHDPAMRWIVGGKAAWSARRRRARWAASRRVGSRPTRTFRLSPIFPANGSTAFMPPSAAEASCSTWIRASVPTHGEQEKSVWNGHYECTCYHPLFVFNQFGDLERCALRPGNVHSADGWERRAQAGRGALRSKVSRIYFRADAGFANPEIYDYLEGRRIKYAIRLPANRVLQERIGYLLNAPRRAAAE